MSVAGTVAITELWAKCKAWFARNIGSSTTATTVSIALKNNAGDTLGSATIAGASATNAGILVADDKSKLDGIEAQANKTVVDSALSSTSTNPVQNKVINTALSGKAASNHSHDAATTSAAGFMSSSDKEKLNGIDSGANAYVHPTSGPSSTGNTSKGDTSAKTPGFGGTFKALSATVDKYGHTTALGEHTVTIPSAVASASTGGSGGSAGLMSAADKEKLNGIAAGANAYTHPTFTAAAAAAKKIGNDAQGHVVIGDALTAADVGAAESSHSHDAASTSAAGFMSSSDKTKLNGIASGAEVNQNAFSNVKIGNNTIAADAKTDTLELIAGDNVTLTPDTTNDKLTIAATDTIYTHPSHTAHSTSAIYKFTNDSSGHVNAATAATASDIVSLLGTTAVNRAKADSSGNTFGAAASKGVDTSISSGSSSTNVPTSKAVSDFVASQITGATAFQGVANSNTDISDSNYVKGYYWVVGTAGTYVGQTCEVGDMIFAIANKGSSYSASDFSVVQNNIVEMTAAEVDAICV